MNKPRIDIGARLTEKRAADVLRDLVARLWLGEVAELLVEHALELERRDESGGVRGGLLVEKETTTVNLIWSQSFILFKMGVLSLSAPVSFIDRRMTTPNFKYDRRRWRKIIFSLFSFSCFPFRKLRARVHVDLAILRFSGTKTNEKELGNVRGVPFRSPDPPL